MGDKKKKARATEKEKRAYDNSPVICDDASVNKESSVP